MKKHVLVMSIATTLMLLATQSAQAQATGYLIMNDANSTQVGGLISWRGGSRQYEIRDPRKPTVARSVSADQVREVRVKKPAPMDAAIRAVSEGRFSGPHIATLEKIVKQYEMLQHDMTAGAALARAYVESGKPAQTEELYGKIKASRTVAELPGELVSAYWDALLKLNKNSILTREIDVTLRKGSRGAVAVAYILKGDIAKKEGKLETALIDGYLRTVVLYRDQKSAQPEALYKAYLSFQELNQVTYAEKMRKKLVEAFPRSSYTLKLQSQN